MEAEDIAQEAFVKAWLASERFDEQYKFRTWLFKIAYRTLLDHAKRPRLERLSEVSDNSELSDISDYTADAAFRYEALYRAIDQLPQRVRAATLLYHIEGYSIKDIATITHSNPVAVRQQLHPLRQMHRSLPHGRRPGKEYQQRRVHPLRRLRAELPGEGHSSRLCGRKSKE